MANNPYVNKVIYDGNTLMDISDTTAEANDVAEGKYFYKADGSKTAGTASAGVKDVTVGGTSIVNAQSVAELVSGTNIKTINNQSILGGGNLNIQGTAVDSSMASTSTNPVQNKVVKQYIDDKINGQVLIWTNSSPNSSFAAQDINLDLSGYHSFIIVMKESNSSSSNYFSNTYIDKEISYKVVERINSYTRQRTFTIFDSYISFSSCTRFTEYGSNTTSTDNTCLIPYKIYGVVGENISSIDGNSINY